MENLVTNAKNFLNSEEGKKLAQSAGFGDSGNNNNQNNNNNENNNNQPSSDAFGNQGQPGQYAQQGQYGAVTGQGFGGGLAKGPDGQALQQGGQALGQDNGQKGSEGQWGSAPAAQGGVDPASKSNYEGWSGEDSTTSGGWGGDAFSRKAQMGADDQGKEPIAEEQDDGYKTGTSTPGYRHVDDVDAEAAENRVRNQNLNTYGAQSDDSVGKGNDYNEQI